MMPPNVHERIAALRALGEQLLWMARADTATVPAPMSAHALTVEQWFEVRQDQEDRAGFTVLSWDDLNDHIGRTLQEMEDDRISRGMDPTEYLAWLDFWSQD